MKSRRTVEDWRKVVFKHPVPAKVKVYLLYLAEHMRTDRTVSVPRKRVASALGCSERRVNDYNAAAREAGFLDVVVRGRKSVTAVYQGLFPEPVSGTYGGPSEDGLRGTKSSPLRTTENPDPMGPLSGTYGGPTSSNQPPSGSAAGHVPNGGRLGVGDPWVGAHGDVSAREAREWSA